MDNKAKLNDLSSRLVDNNNKMINDKLAEFKKELLDDTGGNAAMPEDIFVEHFLPYFKNFNKPENKDNTLLYKWIQVAGSLYNSVDLINNEGKVVNTVPPILKRDAINTDKLVRKDAFSNMAMAYTMDSASSPVIAENNMAKKMNSMGPFINPLSTANEIANKWISLFKQYSKTDEKTEEKEQESKIPKRVKEDLGLDYSD